MKKGFLIILLGTFIIIVLSLIFTITIYKFKIRKLRKILHDFEKANNL